MSVLGKFRGTIAFFYGNPAAAGLVLGLSCVLVAALYWTFHQSDSPQEQKADDARVESIAANSNLAVQAPAVKEAEKTSKAARKTTQEAEKAVPAAQKRVEQAKEPKKDVKVEEAKKVLCEAYPDSEVCR